jgi:hypothetical protein
MNIEKIKIAGAAIIAPCALYFVACDPPPSPTPTTTVRSLDQAGALALDGDAVSEENLLQSEASDDWDMVNNNAGSPVARTGVIEDPAPNQSTFTGGRKDIQDISEWKHKAGSVPDKDDITNAYAAAYEENGDLIIYFGADRFANDGDAQVGFWFFQDNVRALPNGSFSGNHQPGDILVLANFEQGGSAPVISVLEWVGTGGDQQGGTLHEVIAPGDALCGLTAGHACAITNTTPETSPWDYSPKSGTADVFPPQSFFEGGINLTQTLGHDVPCFAGFLAETRSSTSVASTLKDFAVGELGVCNIAIAKSCFAVEVNEDETGFIYSYEGTVTNTGFGILYDVSVTSQGEKFSWPTIPAGESVVFEGNFESTLKPDITKATVEAAGVPGGPPVFEAEAEDECPVPPINPMISVTRECSLELEDVGDEVIVVVNYEGQVCNTSSGDGAIGLTNVELTDDAGTPDDPSDDAVHEIGDLPVDGCAPYSGSYIPSSTSSTSPHEAQFSATSSATGVAKLDFGNVAESASATCGLCPL